MLTIAVFGSGRGSNFQAILHAVNQGSVPGARIACVISNNSTAGILETARAHSIPALHLSQKNFPDQDSFAHHLLEVLRRHDVNFIALAGYMKLLPSAIITTYRQRIVNIHPALLPKFGGKGMYGLHVHEAVLKAGEHESGASVHFVDEVYDHGTVILQKRVPVRPDDTPETLAARVLAVEHEIYPEVLRRFARGDISIPDPRPALTHS
jgi:formyltetrahydrofolate-dependent phosphoribosylglycinamide formyltransferase